ncbi:MAG: DUF58 domain-containing protein [Endomicrobiia bacterium]
MRKYKYIQEDVLKQISALTLEIKEKTNGIFSGKHTSWLIGRSLDFLQHREYYAGDDIKLIDWKIYGRRDKFFIKQFHQETNLEVNFFIDCSLSMWYPEYSLTKYEYASFLCSYLSYILLNQNDKVGIIRFDHEIKDILSSSSTEGFYYKILEFLENEIKGSHSDFKNLVKKILNQFKKKSLIILISDLISEDETITVKLLKNVASYGINLMILHTVCLEEKELDLSYENVKFKDIENEDIEIKTNIVEIKDLYKMKFSNLINYYNRELNGENIKYKTIYTFLPVLENLKFILE